MILQDASKKTTAESGMARMNAVSSVPTSAAAKRSRRRPPVGAVLRPEERRQLAGLTLFDERTILKWERGGEVTARTRKELEAGARRLGLPVPPKKAAAKS